MQITHWRKVSTTSGGIPLPTGNPVGRAESAAQETRTAPTPAGNAEGSTMQPRKSTMRTRFGHDRRHGAPPEWASLVMTDHFKRDMNFTDPELRTCYEAS